MHYKYRILYGDGNPVGVVADFNGRIGSLYLRDYFHGVRRIPDVPDSLALEDVSGQHYPLPVRQSHRKLTLGEIQVSDELPVSDSIEKRIQVYQWLKNQARQSLMYQEAA